MMTTTDIENDLKKYMDTIPSRAVLPMFKSDENETRVDSPAPGIQGFDVDSDDEDQDLNPWPYNHGDLQAGSCVMGGTTKLHEKRSNSPTPSELNSKLVLNRMTSTSLFGRKLEVVLIKPEVSRADMTPLSPPLPKSRLPSSSPPCKSYGNETGSPHVGEVSRHFDQVFHLINRPQNMPSFSQLRTSNEAGSSSKPSAEASGLEALRNPAVDNVCLQGSGALIENATSVTSSASIAITTLHNHEQPPFHVFPQVTPISSTRVKDANPIVNINTFERAPPLSDDRDENSTGAEGQRHASVQRPMDNNRNIQATQLPERRVKKGDIGKIKLFSCPAPWCKLSFTRSNDADRHFKNAAIHKHPGSKDTSTRCGKCGEELSRPDARKRHELKGSCGKRRITRKPPGPW